MVLSKPLTEKEKGVRQHLVDKVNRAKTKSSKKRLYDELMKFEDKMLNEGKNG